MYKAQKSLREFLQTKVLGNKLSADFYKEFDFTVKGRSVTVKGVVKNSEASRPQLLSSEGKKVEISHIDYAHQMYEFMSDYRDFLRGEDNNEKVKKCLAKLNGMSISQAEEYLISEGVIKIWESDLEKNMYNISYINNVQAFVNIFESYQKALKDKDSTEEMTKAHALALIDFYKTGNLWYKRVANILKDSIDEGYTGVTLDSYECSVFSYDYIKEYFVNKYGINRIIYLGGCSYDIQNIAEFVYHGCKLYHTVLSRSRVAVIIEFPNEDK